MNDYVVLVSEDGQPYISHHGIKGMKWGIKNGPPYPIDENRQYLNKHIDERTVLTTKVNGGSMTLEQIPRTLINKGLSIINKRVFENTMQTKIMKIKIDGKTVGDLQLYQESKDSINGVWLGINEKQRGKGYATAALSAAIKYAKERGYKQFTLEVPGNSPDARHIYEKLGFNAIGEVTSADEDYVWGGLTAMKLKL